MDELDPESLERGIRPGGGEVGPAEKALPFVELLATIWSRVVLGLLLFLGFVCGFWVAGVGLHDPDTCWLLALGRYIVEHHQIPLTDPFSWTFAAEEAAGHHFILYQWLTEVVFYLSTLPAGLVTLLLLCAVVISTAYLSIPMSWVVRREAPFVKSIWVVVLGMLAASFHTLARPEIFSYLFLALFLQSVHDMRVSMLEEQKKVFPLILIAAPLMVLWANMHTGFISGLAVLLALTLGTGLGFLLFKAPVKSIFLASVAALLASLAAVLCNPYGFSLYSYIPQLFNSPINKYIIELQPVIDGELVTTPDLYPFLFLCLLFVFLFARESVSFIRRRHLLSTTQKSLVATELLLGMIFGFVAIYNGLEHRRVASFVTLILVGEVIALLSMAKKRKVFSSLKDRFGDLLDSHSLDLWKEGGAFEMAIVALCALAGVTLVCFRISPPQLPAGSKVFSAPFAALKFIESHPPLGRLYNDQHFGDVLIYYLNGNPKVFIDTRFDMYGPKIVEEYRTIHECQPGWQELLSKREIAWAFLLPDAPITKELVKNPDWRELYRDEKSVILERKK